MAIDIEGLVKTYRSVRAVDGISFTVPDGAMFSFVGSNGAGKSTTIGCLTTLLPFDDGRVRVAGHDVRTDGAAVRGEIGVVFQQSLLDDQLTVDENLRMRGELAGVPRAQVQRRIRSVAATIELDGLLDRRYGALSGGQRRRADIARALIGEPSILFLDEPTAGLDPASRAAVWRAIGGLRAEEGITVFLTTHYMEETEDADDVCIIDAGRIVAHGSPARLRALHSSSVLRIESDDADALVALAATEGAPVRRRGEVVSITVADASAARRLLAAHGDAVRDFEFRHGSMDDVFLAVTGQDSDERDEAP